MNHDIFPRSRLHFGIFGAARLVVHKAAETLRSVMSRAGES
jgi:hypothetical protein